MSFNHFYSRPITILSTNFDKSNIEKIFLKNFGEIYNFKNIICNKLILSFLEMVPSNFSVYIIWNINQYFYNESFYGNDSVMYVKCDGII